MFMVDVSNSFMVARNQHNWAPRNFTDDSPLASQVRLKAFLPCIERHGLRCGYLSQGDCHGRGERSHAAADQRWRQATGTRSMPGSRVWSKLGRAGGLSIKQVIRIYLKKREKNLGVKQLRIDNFGFTVPTKIRVKLQKRRFNMV